MEYGKRIVKELRRPSESLLSRVREFSTPELCDGMKTYNAMDYLVKPQVPCAAVKLVGPAVTVRLPLGAGRLVTRAIELAQPGDILVLAGQGNCRSSLWGDHRSLCAMMKGLQGVVIDGAFRDLEGCREVGFPVYAKALVCGSAVQSEEGEINVPVDCAGAIVRPGDIVVADVNGVCVLPVEHAEEILAQAARKVAAQQKVIEEMKRTGRIITQVQL